MDIIGILVTGGTFDKEYAEDWETERNYIREDKVLGSMELAMS